MKKSSLLLLVLIALTWVGCEPTVQTTITIEPSSLTLLEGDVDTLTAVVTPQGEVFQFDFINYVINLLKVQQV